MRFRPRLRPTAPSATTRIAANAAVAGYKRRCLRILWNGTPAQLIDAARRDEVELCTSRPLLAELARILQRTKFAKVIAASGMTFDQLVLGYAGLTTLIAPAEIPPTILNDPDDDHVLACAVAAKADLIVSGDSDLLDLKAYQGIPIETPAEALRRICAS